ncbi:hypothetical protein [Tunicatimonas pelagia]|uniref:hypothetical protein n=1 Tax=Tunicatimonas pelagia TaxID=931531 RepID=UPI002664F611|nr:hypothetical protein [Tunicatimonas pelagia]WKN42548.1 hypothetical protein P0M28_26280 [Tunicatimonas pelagia]
MMKKSKIALSVGTGLVGMLGMSGCLPDEDFSDVEVKVPSPQVSLPLFNTTLTVEDMLQTGEEGSLLKNADESYSLFYQSSVQSERVKDYFPAIPNQQFAESHSLGLDASGFSLTGTPPAIFEGSIPFDLNNLTIYSIESERGTLAVTIQSGYQHDLEVEASFPNIISPDGEILTLNFPLPYWNGAGVIEKAEDLSGYEIKLEDGEVSYRLEVSIVGSGQPISSSDEIDFNFSIDGLAFNYISGNFTDIRVPIEADTLGIPALSGVVDGTIATNPNMSLSFSNSYGVPISPDFSRLYIERVDETVVRLQDEEGFDFFSGGFAFPYLSERSPEPITDTYQITSETSNIDDAFSNVPSALAYGFGFGLNSSETDTSFISIESQIGVDLNLEMPLEAGFDITLEDSIAISFDELEDVEQLKLLLKTENDFPISADLQVYFLDSKGNIIEDANGEQIRLFEEEGKFLVAAEIVNSVSGETVPANIDLPTTATINKDKFEKVRDASHLLVRAQFNSVSDESNNRVKLYSFYSIRFSLATQIIALVDA